MPTLTVSKHSKKLVSVIMPTHNSEAHVFDAISSVLTQSYPHWILIVVDDASTDRTVDILAEFARQDKRISFQINTKNLGAAVTRNKALHIAKGRYVAFLDSDDLWHKKKLEHQIGIMEAEALPFTFTSYELIDVHGLPLGKTVDCNSKSPVNYRDMLSKRATMGCSTVVLDRKAIPNIEMPLLRTGQDYALWLKILRQGYEATCIRERLTKYRIVPKSISRNKYQKAKRQWEIYRAIEKLPFIPASWYFINYAWRAIFRA